ncbi:hypothetical protein GUITHDRAFT_101008 [Guillardia theta CCMP2712]|uniref:Uncharacterized protein n=1 Tax=Guillardia theta (strain CCMP2712) TaxID=905079 RepID=L1JYZ6_GUITC|nr:hypothetical protein GUITHDRAFT_101008 [Guillardia theta CCMP2712]EKX53303.1 hypothetical protein GUITHDRAFT_101008 [Guillardia theta CCMP2712]|eukprot:XP_005840283.1 hypothetical protein GUITHDRAFT_101008 [Guillardia theta CCMP2712]
MWESIRPFKPKKSMDINAKLIAACVKGARHIVEHLLQTGADINYLVQPKTGVHKDYIGFTPLSAAAHCGHTSLVKLLVQQGADIKCGREKDPIGKAKFWFALSNMVGDKKIETRKALYAKISPFYGNSTSFVV